MQWNKLPREVVELKFLEVGRLEKMCRWAV